jgi:hypothetical protein
MGKALLIIGATFAAAALVLVFFLGLFVPEPEPAYTPDECTLEPDGFCATWHDYHDNDWE